MTNAKVDRLSSLGEHNSAWLFDFAGRAESRPKLLGAPQTTTIRGALELRVDPFGRITSARHAIDNQGTPSRN